MIVYLAYIRYDPEWSDLVSAHLHQETAEQAALKAVESKWNDLREIYRDDPEELQSLYVHHWVSPLEVKE